MLPAKHSFSCFTKALSHIVILMGTLRYFFSQSSPKYGGFPNSQYKSRFDQHSQNPTLVLASKTWPSTAWQIRLVYFYQRCKFHNNNKLQTMVYSSVPIKIDPGNMIDNFLLDLQKVILDWSDQDRKNENGWSIWHCYNNCTIIPDIPLNYKYWFSNTID